MNYKILNINEWKESDNYIISKWFDNKNRYIKGIFDNNESYRFFKYDRFEHDSTSIGDVRFGYFFFSDDEFTYKMEIILDYNKLLQNNNVQDENIDDKLTDDIVVDVADYKLYLYDRKEPQKHFDSVISKITDEDITDDFLISLINEIKEKNELIN